MTRGVSIHPCLALAAGVLLTASAAQARTFISPMGEPFRSEPPAKEPSELWFEGADRNGDGKITRQELLEDAARFFAILDVDHDREIGPEEIERYEEDVAPEVRSGDGDYHRQEGGDHPTADDVEVKDATDPEGPIPRYDDNAQGAERFGYLDLPEPVVAADTDLNRGVSSKEFAAAAMQRFDLLDTNHDGVITRDDLVGLGHHRTPVRSGNSSGQRGRGHGGHGHGGFGGGGMGGGGYGGGGPGD